MQAFTRQLGYESGVQLNPLIDGSEVPSTGNYDQCFGIMMRATRGRIDRPFVVSRGDVYKKLGYGEPIRTNALNEAWVEVVEALNNGAYQAVVQRLTTDAAKIKYAVVKLKTEEGEDTSMTNSYEFSVEEEAPTSDFVFAVKHLECFNDGIKIQFHADEALSDELEKVGNPVVTLRVLDVKDGSTLYEFKGSLDVDAKDDYGNSNYLPDVVASQTNNLELTVGVTGENAAVLPDTAAYGYNDSGFQNWQESDVLVCFEEGGHAYTTQDYQRARENLQYTQFDFSYISSGATQAPALLAQLAQLAFDTNKQLRFDVPGNLSVDAAIAFVEQLNMGANKTAHLLQAFWAPLKTDDPTGVNPKGYFGCATLNIALACGRNAIKDGKGFAPKNYPIAGREWQINRTGIMQTATLRSPDLSKLAAAKINPCIFETYSGGGRYVFFDSLTCAKVESSFRKLISVADMSSSIDDLITRAAKDFLQLPMDVAVRRTDTFLKNLFDGAQQARWIVPASDPQMQGRAAAWEVKPSELNPMDQMIVNYWVRYDGCARQIFESQTITR